MFGEENNRLWNGIRRAGSSVFRLPLTESPLSRPTVRNIFQCRSDGRSDVFWSLPMM